MASAWAIVCASLLVVQVPCDRAGELIPRLGSNQFAEREAASRALEGLGPAALPTLRAASGSQDPEVRRRAAAITARLEWLELTSASFIRLDFTDLAMDEILERIGGLPPGRLAWLPDGPESARRRYTIHEPAPLSFWTAIDRLRQAGNLHYIPGSPDGGHPAQFRLFLAPGRTDCPHADDGPLRLEIVGLYHSKSVNLIPGRKRDAYSRGRRFGNEEYGARQEEFMAYMRILAEPRMLMNQVGSTLITAAVDDRGQSLLPGPTPFLYHFGVGYGGNLFACTDYVVKFQHPKEPGNVVKRLRMTIPVGVTALNPDRLEIPLEGASGKTFRHGKVSITIVSISRDSPGHQHIKVKLTSDERVYVELSFDQDGGLAPGASRPALPSITPSEILILDREGRQYPWHVGDVHADDSGATADLILWPGGGIPMPMRVGKGIVPVKDRQSAVPAVLYHTGATQGVIVATFEFTDVPLP